MNLLALGRLYIAEREVQEVLSPLPDRPRAILDLDVSLEDVIFIVTKFKREWARLWGRELVRAFLSLTTITGFLTIQRAMGMAQEFPHAQVRSQVVECAARF